MSNTFRPIGSRPQRNPSLGREYWPGLHGKPTLGQAVLWSQGAKDGLAYAADIIRNSKSIGEALSRIEASTAVAADKVQDGHEYQTAIIVERSGEGAAWWAWSIHAAGDPLPETFRAKVEPPSAPQPAPKPVGSWLSGEDMIGAFYAK